MRSLPWVGLWLLACAPAAVDRPAEAPPAIPSSVAAPTAEPGSVPMVAAKDDECRNRPDEDGCHRLEGDDDEPDVAEPAPSEPAKGPFTPSNHPGMRDPRRARERAPEHFDVFFDTTVGDILLTCHRAMAPHGADRFYSLLRIGYFDDVAFFRAVDGFVVQFGIHGLPAVNRAWKNANIEPDEVRAPNLEGTLTFAQAGAPAAPGMTAASRSTQLFFNLGDNRRLDEMGFAPLCKVVEGMESLHAIHTGYGEQAGRDQTAIREQGNDYLRRTYPALDYIRRAGVLPPR
ncbi:MAG: peptidylprolyl isomerase [Polyangiaceae bacterium]